MDVTANAHLNYYTEMMTSGSSQQHTIKISERGGDNYKKVRKYVM